MFFDVAKYLLTTTAVGSFVVKDVNLIASAIATLASFALIAIAYYITPPRIGRTNMEIVAAIAVATVIVAAIFAFYIHRQEKVKH